MPDLLSGGFRFEFRPGLLRTKVTVYSAFHPSGKWVGKWVRAAAGKAKAGMAHSACGWNEGCAGKTVLSLDNACLLIPERLRDVSCGGAIQIDYLYLFIMQMQAVTNALSHCSVWIPDERGYFLRCHKGDGDEAATICLRPSTPHAADQHALRLRRPARLASSSCGRHEYSRCTRQTDVRHASSINDSVLSGRRHNDDQCRRLGPTASPQ